MIETPSSALTISQILKLPLEGVVVGLNDLTAFTLAIDRNDPHIQAIYHQSHPAVLKLLEIIIKAVLLSRKQIYISGEGIIDYYDVLEKCLSLGATNLCVPVKRLPAFISEVSACELKIARNSHG